MSLKNDLNKYTPRIEQENVLNYVKKIYEEKPDNKFFLLNLPTGIGKSYLAVMLGDFFMKKKPGIKVDMITAGKLLQNQYSETFEEIKSLKGKENYQCETYACNCFTGKEFSALNKSKCDFCPYDIARNDFVESEVSLTNFHLYLVSVIYGGEKGLMSGRKDSKLLIVDEAHSLDDIVSDFIAIKMSQRVDNKSWLLSQYHPIQQRDLPGMINLVLNKTNH